MMAKITRWGISALALSSAGIGAAHAQSASQSGIWTIQDDNASISTASPTDRYYVNGFYIGWTSPKNDVPAPLAALGNWAWGDGTSRISIGLIQQVYTPNDTSAINPPLNDEPYAGYLAASFGLITDTGNTRSVLGANIGVIGRDAGAELVQNDFHSIIGQKGTHGWAYQLPSEPALDFFGARIWRVPVAQFDNGLAIDALPQVSEMAGLTQVYVQPAIGFRFGSGLDSDFGPPLLSPAPSGTNAYEATQPLVWYLFGSAAGKLVGHDEFLQGSDFQNSRSVDPRRFVGTFEAGGAIIWRGLRFSYTQVFQTNTYFGQQGSIHEYGSFSVSGSF